MLRDLDAVSVLCRHVRGTLRRGLRGRRSRQLPAAGGQLAFLPRSEGAAAAPLLPRNPQLRLRQLNMGRVHVFIAYGGSGLRKLEIWSMFSFSQLALQYLQQAWQHTTELSQ